MFKAAVIRGGISTPEWTTQGSGKKTCWSMINLHNMFNDPEGTRINFHEAHISKPHMEAKRFNLRMYLKHVCALEVLHTQTSGLADSQKSCVARCFNMSLAILAEWYSYPLSGQIIIFHQPRFPWNKGISLPNSYILGEIGRVRSRANLTSTIPILPGFSMVFGYAKRVLCTFLLRAKLRWCCYIVPASGSVPIQNNARPTRGKVWYHSEPASDRLEMRKKDPTKKGGGPWLFRVK